MQVRLSQLAELTQGVLTGDPNLSIDKAAPLHTADATAITFAERPERLDWYAVTQARAAVVPLGAEQPTPDVATIQVADVKEAFEKIKKTLRGLLTLLNIASEIAIETSA